MIKIKESVPNVYTQQSRDFQFIGRLFDVVLNSVKTNVDLIENLPLNDNLSGKIAEVLATTLGFKSRHNYNVKHLIAICSVFPEILHKKGTIESIEIAGRALLRAEGITEDIKCTVEDCNLTIFLPTGLSDINLFKDLLVYILPAGMTVSIVRAVSTSALIATIISTDDSVKYSEIPANITKENIESSKLYSVIIKPEDISIFNKYEIKGTLINSTVLKNK